MKIIDFFVSAFVKRINKTFVHNQKYKIENYQIVIPSSLNLPRNQKKYPLYDKFLPVLASHLPPGTVVDVGANVGDTLAAMAQKCSNSFICVEPSNKFFRYLEKNATEIRKKSNKEIKLVKELIGSGKLSGYLIDDGSTAFVKITDNQDIVSKHVQLDTLVNEQTEVVLIKSDVDGYDFDVIRSSEKILKKSHPILFWENEISNDIQYADFSNFYAFLEELGYLYVYIFDNFGNLLVEKSNYNTLRDINAYLYNMKKFNATRTFFYTDILASTEKRRLIVERAVADYKNNFIKQPHCKAGEF